MPTSTVQGTYDETVRRNFLLTHGLKFVSTERARKRYRHGVGQEKMKAEPVVPSGTIPP